MSTYAKSISSKKGEDQPRLLLFFFVAASLSGLVAVIVYMAVAASTNASHVVLEDQKGVDIYSANVVHGLFSVLNARYVGGENASCAIGSEFKRPAILTIRFRTRQTPDTCSIFANGALLHSERRLEADCGVSCPFSEYDRQFSLGEFDYRDDHAVRVCCDDICIDKQVTRLCNPLSDS